MSPYYVYFYRGGRDASEHLVVVPQGTFERIWPHSNHLDMAWYHDVPADVMALVDTLHALPDADLCPSEMEAIPDDHFIRITLC